MISVSSLQEESQTVRLAVKPKHEVVTGLSGHSATGS